MQDRTTAHVYQFLFVHPHNTRQAKSQFGDTLSVPLRPSVAQIKGARPSFDSGVVSLRQFDIGTSQVADERNMVYGDGCLHCQSLQKVEPFRVRVERSAVEEFEHTRDLPFHNEWHAVVGNKSLGGKPPRARKLARLGD